MPFHDMYEYQTKTQQYMVDKGFYKVKYEKVPCDSAEIAGYHLLHLTSEVGELINSDARWKSHRVATFDPNEKLEELADIFIEWMNVAIFSGFTPEMIFSAVADKLVTVRRRAVREAEGEVEPNGERGD